MRVMITGAAGFIGRSLTAMLLDAGRLADGHGGDSAIEEIVVVDRGFPDETEWRVPDTIRVVQMTGDLCDATFADRVASVGVDTVFHLAAALTLDAEVDDDAAYLVNVESIRRFISRSSASTRFVFASSIAVFGGELPPTVTDRERFAPETTYGAHKAIAELLLADAARKNRLDARILRLPIVLIRRGANTPAVSDRIAAIVREPLAGRDVVSPLEAETQIPVASATAVAKALIQLHDTPAEMLPPWRAMNLPSLTVSVEQMIVSTFRHGNKGTLGAVRFVPDARLQAIVDGWPRAFVSDAATSLGIVGDQSIDDIVSEYVHGRRTS
ncbi:NAD-dependent epimerase/dehydratase family protein [Paraburkholderia sp. USG1]|uniref:NAD-dependent epimerase/dehydratase family protein n=1 Tax=Paraburkholderia sp. USG1 TaxID=2952268 RepID=UPI002856054A|nr:NAD-dependent epimerase/dehydratase family protein [Paraburkholderia sp. USG1]MDR8401833.1 NAD-dependent epimerase/dehydratase family protein [Paraburkholderia sp. USG1]